MYSKIFWLLDVRTIFQKICRPTFVLNIKRVEVDFDKFANVLLWNSTSFWKIIIRSRERFISLVSLDVFIKCCCKVKLMLIFVLGRKFEAYVTYWTTQGIFLISHSFYHTISICWYRFRKKKNIKKVCTLNSQTLLSQPLTHHTFFKTLCWLFINCEWLCRKGIYIFVESAVSELFHISRIYTQVCFGASPIYLYLFYL